MMTAYYVDDTPQGYVITTQAANSVAGPFTTRAQARTWENAHPIPGAAQWWVIWTDNPAESQRSQEQTYHVVSLATPPAVGSTWKGLTVTSVQGPYPSEAAAEQAIGAPGKPTGTGEGSGPGHANPTGPNVPGGLAAIGDFFARLGQASTWIRVAEVLLGLGLIVVGLAKIASGTAVGKAAVKVGETAAIL